MPDQPTRRDFLKTSALAGAAAAMGVEPPRGEVANSKTSGLPDPRTSGYPAPPPSWIERPMRWAQLTLVENDPGTYDPKFWLDYFRRTKADAVCLSAGGCVAYYPTAVPFHHRSEWLRDTDPFGELVAGCRKLGMVVVA